MFVIQKYLPKMLEPQERRREQNRMGGSLVVLPFQNKAPSAVIQAGDPPIGKVRGPSGWVRALPPTPPQKDQRPDWVLQSPSTTQGAKVTDMEQTYQPGEKGAPGKTQVPVLGAPVEKGGAEDPLTPQPVPPCPPTPNLRWNRQTDKRTNATEG